MIARGTVFLLVLSMSFLSAPTLHDFGGASINVYDVLLLWCLGVAGVIVCMTRRVKVSMGASIVPLLIHYALLVVLPVVGFIVYQYDIGNVTSSIRFAFIVSSISALWLMVAGKEEPVMRALMCALFIGLLGNFSLASLQHAEFFGMIQGEYLPHYWYEDMVENPKFNNPGRAVGFFSGPNQLGWYGVISFMLFLGTLLAGKACARHRIGIMMSLGIIILANSRSALISTVVGVAIVLLCLLISKEKVGKYIVGLIFLSLVTLWFIFSTDIGRYIARGLMAIAELDMSRDSSFASRSEGTWVVAIAAFEDHPFGYLGDPVELAGTIDSGWISYLLQGGALLVLSYAIVLGAAIYRSLQHLRCRASVHRRMIAISCIGVTVALAVGSIVLSPFHYLHVMIIFLLLYMANSHKHESGQ